MLIEIKVKVAYIANNKVRKTLETWLIDKEFFSEAEYTVTQTLTTSPHKEKVKEFEILSMRTSPLKEIAEQFSGEHTYIATLRDTWTDDDGNEKHLRYKILLWADDLTEANKNTQTLAKEGYDMLIEGIKQADYRYIVDYTDAT